MSVGNLCSQPACMELPGSKGVYRGLVSLLKCAEKQNTNQYLKELFCHSDGIAS